MDEAKRNSAGRGESKHNMIWLQPASYLLNRIPILIRRFIIANKPPRKPLKPSLSFMINGLIKHTIWKFWSD